MKKRILALIPILALCACNNGGGKNDPIPDPSDDDEWENSEPTEHDWLDERDYTYTNLLEKPSTTVHNVEELMAICDYYAFYKKEKFVVTPASNYVFSVPGKETLKYELNYLYWHQELINGCIGMDAFAKNGKWYFTFDDYQPAYKESSPFFTDFDNALEPIGNVSRGQSYDNFATDDESKPLCDVATTQQLFYAAEHGYRVNPIEGSPAEKYYAKCKELLNDLMGENMSDFDIAKTIYDYIANAVTYDYAAAYMGQETENPDLYPDVYCSGDKCYYVEGLFDQNLLVCDGLAKTYTLLGRMEGLNIYRASGTSDKEFGSRALPGHAYCFVEVDDEWYLSDITWGMAHFNAGDYYGEAINHQYFLTSHNGIAPYTSTDWPEIQDVMKQEGFGTSPDPFGNLQKYFSSTYFEYNGERYPLYLNSENCSEVVSAMVSKLQSGVKTNQTYIDLFAVGETVVNYVYSELQTVGYRCIALYNYDGPQGEMLFVKTN